MSYMYRYQILKVHEKHWLASQNEFLFQNFELEGRCRFVHRDLAFLPIGTSWSTGSETCFFQSSQWPYGELGTYCIFIEPKSALSSYVTGVSNSSIISRLSSSKDTITNW